MTVYCVMEDDYEESYLRSIWSTRELADIECGILQGKFQRKYSFPIMPNFSVDEFIVDKEGTP